MASKMGRTGESSIAPKVGPFRTIGEGTMARPRCSEVDGICGAVVIGGADLPEHCGPSHGFGFGFEGEPRSVD